MLMDTHGADRGDTGFTKSNGNIIITVGLSATSTSASFAPRGGRAENLINNVKSESPCSTCEGTGKCVECEGTGKCVVCKGIGKEGS